MNGKRLVVVGAGGAAFREYALRSIAARAEVVLVSDRPCSWEAAYCAETVTVDLTDRDAVRDVVAKVGADGLVTYDERYVEITAEVNQSFGWPGASAAAVRSVKDKSAFRALQAAAGVAPLPFAVADTVEAAEAAVDEIGLPVVFKPRALGGSAGVVMVTERAAVAAAFDAATTARVGTIKSRYDGVLIEKYVDGPELSIDSVTYDGVTTPLVVALKSTGLEPYFEETGHVVPAPPELATPELLDLVRRAHELAGLDCLVSHTEVRLGADGPQIIELNARLGGDLIPYLGLLAHGVDLAAAVADLALGRPPAIHHQESGAAAVRFRYPTEDLRVRSVELPEPWASDPRVDTFASLAGAGVEMRLPPRGYMSRLAVVVTRAADGETATALAQQANDAIVVDAEPLPLPDAGKAQ